jgi:hypothetical protein
VKASEDEENPESPVDAYTSSLGADESVSGEQLRKDRVEKSDGQFRKQLSRNARKAQRQSRPATVLASLGDLAIELYTIAPPGKVDLSYTKPRRNATKHRSQRNSNALPSPDNTDALPEPVTLYSILSRYLEHHVMMQSPATSDASPAADTPDQTLPTEFAHTQPELDFLRARGYTTANVEMWASSLAERRSRVAAEIFEPGRDMPPMFLLLLYLRRKHIKVSALSVIMRHVDRRIRAQSVGWDALKIIVVRLLRHARGLWPESLPWIASLFTAEAARSYSDEKGSRSLSPKMHSDVTHFCNNLLSLLSLPTSSSPVLYASHQQKAQFDILHYMASSSPPIVVSRVGFRSVTRNQLAHPKTRREREWAELKGPSWPPWKEDRTAMDEDKSYEFGASRASKILHRLYEAGYGGHIWEDIAQVYAGWDVDNSPTIQSRTSLPRFSSQFGDVKALRSLLWAARIRTTRTRREAWAAFLSHEMSGDAAHQEIYLAMFEKLYYETAERSVQRDFDSEPIEDSDGPITHLLPGDMKEVLPDPMSPLHNVFLSEIVPTYEGLFQRMLSAHLCPSNRLLAFLLESCPDFNMGLKILSIASNECDGAIGRLAGGIHDTDHSISNMPDYLFTAFIRFLCRFGRYYQLSPTRPTFREPEQHALAFKAGKQYLLEYAHSLLAHYAPKYRPAWTAFANKVVHQNSQMAGNAVRFRIVCDIIDKMEQLDLDVDDEIFRLACMATVYAVQSSEQGTADIVDAHHLFSTASSRLRTLFASLVDAHAETSKLSSKRQQESTIPPHIPGPAELHAYIRALGILRDYEGLYSISTWLAKYHAEVTARAEARHSGSKLLFRTLVALRAAVDGPVQEQGAPDDIAQLIRMQIESVEEWGGWPDQSYVDMYRKGHLKTPMPGVGGR